MSVNRIARYFATEKPKRAQRLRRPVGHHHWAYVFPVAFRSHLIEIHVKFYTRRWWRYLRIEEFNPGPWWVTPMGPMVLGVYATIDGVPLEGPALPREGARA